MEEDCEIRGRVLRPIEEETRDGLVGLRCQCYS